MSRSESMRQGASSGKSEFDEFMSCIVAAPQPRADPAQSPSGAIRGAGFG